MGLGGIGEVEFGSDFGKKKKKFAPTDEDFLKQLLNVIDTKENTAEVKSIDPSMLTTSTKGIAPHAFLGIQDISQVTPEKLEHLSDAEKIEILLPLINKLMATENRPPQAAS